MNFIYSSEREHDIGKKNIFEKREFEKLFRA